MAMSVDRRLAAIMAIDIVGYSRLVEADEAATLAAIKELRHALIDPLLVEHHGRIVKLMGDGAIIEFGSVVDAVAGAVALQKGCATRQGDRPSARQIVFRIGVNLGDVVVEGEDLLGDGVNVAARLEQLCSPGGILISGTVFDHLQGKLDHLVLDYAGDQHVKNIARPVRTYKVRLDGGRRPWRLRMRPHLGKLRWAVAILILLFVAGGTWWWLQPIERTSVRASIAVLPFDDLSGSEATGRLADGITEDIITDLSRINEFDVIALNSTEAFKEKPVDVQKIGRQLGVGYVLEGSIQRQAERIRTTAQLISTTTGAHLWSERWDRPAEDLFAVQTDIAERVVIEFELTTGPIKAAELGAVRRRRPQSLTAYELELLGAEKLTSLTRERVAEATDLFRQAIAADPNYARAWNGLAWALTLAVNFGADTEASNRMALEAAEKAIALDPYDAGAHGALGEILGRRGELGHAKAEMDTALALNPGSFRILIYYLSWASSFGEPERGAEMADRAIRLNPNYPSWACGGLRYAYFMVGRYQDALRVMERQTPDNYSKFAWVERAGSFAALGRATEAQATVQEALKRYPNLTIEGHVNDPGLNDVERQRLAETMRLAGFPACAPPEEMSKLDTPLRLSECAAKP
ncbi:adenylate/guanylate cyclase domain-containing protein [Mycobacterium sp. KBS0706]|uniref:adenylate/guanylate cyclase domain-containing protein n=1 Tax=Mycobacterium sp. KBS0706 TaxID=2578109 RepID=UPI00110FE375|nr:adenylate/guanylate cyclase domain-containing protein [Mycobacterium sp. KBS0706]TSD86088.1 adenylate/guanylate cyclase domain-containing protein [Mycobacterium sp. KBS0706]